MKPTLRILSGCLSLFLLLSCFSSCGKTVQEDPIEKILSREREAWGVENDGDLFSRLEGQAGTTESDWLAFCLALQGEVQGKDRYLESLETVLEKTVSSEKGLAGTLVTELQRICLCAMALGGDVRHFGGIDLLAQSSFDRGRVKDLSSQGVNGIIWALILLGGSETTPPKAAFQSTFDLITLLLSAQREDGGFAMGKLPSDVDLTAMAITALSFYRNEEGVEAGIERALDFLSKNQLSSGGFESYGEENAASISQVILALSALGMDAKKDPLFQKEADPVTALMAFQRSDGGFAMKKKDENSSTMATHQALMAFLSIKFQQEGKGSIFDFGKTK